MQGGIYADPKDPVAIKKFRDGGSWDKEADVELLREKYVVSIHLFFILFWSCLWRGKG